MRPIQNAGGEEVIHARSYPVASATAIVAGQVVQLSAGKVVPAIAAQTGAILGIAGEDHPGTADMLNSIRAQTATRPMTIIAIEIL